MVDMMKNRHFPLSGNTICNKMIGIDSLLHEMYFTSEIFLFVNFIWFEKVI